MLSLNNTNKQALVKETQDLVNDFRAYEKTVYNVTSLAEFQRMWLPSFSNYFHQIKNHDGELYDKDGEVLAFWNARRLENGGTASMFLDTHIIENGETLYIIPSTVTPIATLVTDVAIEASLYTLVSIAASNPIPAFREIEASNAIIAKYNSRKEDYTDAYRKHLILNHMFIKEGLPPIINPVDKEESKAVSKATEEVLTQIFADDEDDDFSFGVRE